MVLVLKSSIAAEAYQADPSRFQIYLRSVSRQGLPPARQPSTVPGEQFNTRATTWAGRATRSHSPASRDAWISAAQLTISSPTFFGRGGRQRHPPPLSATKKIRFFPRRKN